MSLNVAMEWAELGVNHSNWHNEISITCMEAWNCDTVEIIA